MVFRWPECTLKNSKRSINIVMRSDVDHCSTLRAQKIGKTHRNMISKVSTPPPRMPVANDMLGWKNPLLKLYELIMVVTGILGGGSRSKIHLIYQTPPQQWCRHSAAPWFRGLAVKHWPQRLGKMLTWKKYNKFYLQEVGQLFLAYFYIFFTRHIIKQIIVIFYWKMLDFIRICSEATLVELTTAFLLTKVTKSPWKVRILLNLQVLQLHPVFCFFWLATSLKNNEQLWDHPPSRTQFLSLCSYAGSKKPISWHSTVPKRRSSFTVTWVMRTSKKTGAYRVGFFMIPFGGLPFNFSIKPNPVTNSEVTQRISWCTINFSASKSQVGCHLKISTIKKSI